MRNVNAIIFDMDEVIIDDAFNEIIPIFIKNRRNISESKFLDSKINN